MSGYNSKKDFKLKYAMTNHTYSTNIEALFGASIDQVVKVLEQSDTICNGSSLKELMHRKGLNMRFLWVVLARLRLTQAREMVMTEILMRVMRRIVNEEIKLKCKVDTVGEEYYQGNQSDQYNDVLVFYVNTLLKKKLSKHREVFDETLLGLFLSRMAVLGIVYSLNLKREEFFYLQSVDVLVDVFETPSKNPALFINALQTYFHVDLNPDFLRLVRSDKLAFLAKSQPFSKTDIRSLTFKMQQVLTIREQAYFNLARSITHASRTNQSAGQKIPGKIKTKSDKDKIKNSFQKPASAATTVTLEKPRVGGGGIGPQSLKGEGDQQDS